MPRNARTQSSSGIYHVILRGINRQCIFSDREDYEQFIYLLVKFKEKCEYEIYAWCLMPNHIHLLIKEGIEPLSQVFRRLGASFVYWYNTKYERAGHLFQDRYKSEAVENTRYLMTVVRYIHQNPVKAGLCTHLEDYPYSSYRAYFIGHRLLNPDFILGIMGIDEFASYHHETADDPCLDILEMIPKRISDEKIQKLTKDYYHIQTVTEVQVFEKTRQKEAIQLMLKSGASIRQVSRLTGISIGIVRGAGKNIKDR